MFILDTTTGYLFLEKLLDALRQCEPEMPTLLGGLGPCGSMDFFASTNTHNSSALTGSGNGLVEDGRISSTSSPQSSLSATVSSPPVAATMVVHTLAELYDRELVSTIGWAKQIPG